MRRLTDHQMLRAAQRRLDEHLSTRPATAAEAAEIRRGLLAEAAAYREAAGSYREIRYSPHDLRRRVEVGRTVTGEMITRPLWPTIYSEIRETRQERNRLEHFAKQAEMHAHAWICEGEDLSDVWESTRDELQGRVDYYRGLITSRSA